VVQRVVDRARERRLLRQRRQLGPDRRFERGEQRLALLLPHTQPLIGRLAANAGFDAVELADHLQQFLGVRSRRAHMDLVILSPAMIPTRRFVDIAARVQLIETGVGIRL
jgi:hypothetical protein